ncbi:hypothetical protein EIP91_003085 [Steccherinum ochraceum]|uniref:Uncharacterized protein n=1 Tax=Steccherinum ochraceum TaxID=92696 RepID=A0A4R0RB00_9APHY|nr:hypothetical protein EIP91_003085 [Steccherinum ochraceum]
MGGNAFNVKHPEAAFPRMHPEIYERVKAKILAILLPLYNHVTTPPEAPEKVDHGDIDFLVCSPKIDITHEQVKQALGAIWSIPQKVTSHYALPWDTVAGVPTHPQQYIQVDVHVCEDIAEFQRVSFCHSYGDVAMIIGLMARSVGLSFGTSGMRLANPLPTAPPVSFHLCSSMTRILEFLDLSYDRWKEGFTRQREVFEWISSSRFYDPSIMSRAESDHQGGRKAREARGMYQNFLTYAFETKNSGAYKSSLIDKGTAVQSALQFFGKWDLYCRILRVAAVKTHANTVLSGKLVTEWTGVQGTPVRWVMDEVKKRLGGEEEDRPDLDYGDDGGSPMNSIHWTLFAWQAGLETMDVEAVRALTVEVKEEMEKDGRLAFDWREAKKRQAERKKALA